MYKKLISSIVAIVLLFSLVVPTGVSAASNSDLDSAIAELKLLPEASRVLILRKLWQYAVYEKQASGTVTAAGIYDGIKSSFTTDQWSEIVNETPPAKDLLLEKSSVMLVINEVLARKAIFNGMYDSFINAYNGLDSSMKGVVKVLVCPDLTSPSDFEVFAGILTHVNEVVASQNSNGKTVFVAVENVAQNMLIDLLGETNGAAAATILGNTYLSSVNSAMQEYATVLNQFVDTFSIDASVVIKALEIYNLYKDPTLPPVLETQTPAPTDADSANEYLENAGDDIENTTNVSAALEIAKDAISMVSGIVNGTQSEMQQMEQRLQDIVTKVMDKVSTETVTSVVSGTTAMAVINETTAQSLLTKIDSIANSADTLKSEIDQTGLDIRVEKVLKINVTTTASVGNVDVQLPSSVFVAAKDKDIDKLAIETSIATIMIPPDALSVTGSEKVSLSASVVDKSLLPEDVQTAVGNETVYDFNMIVGTSKVSEFKKKLEVSVPYTLKPGENPKKVTVFYINDKGQLENIVGKYDAKTGSVSFTTKHFSQYVVMENAVTFGDLGSAEWAREYIESMASKGILTGVGNDKYDPAASLTRAQFAAMIVRACGLADDTAENVFADVKSTDWFSHDVAAAYNAGIINGRTATVFAPNDKVTREEMVQMIARALVNVKGRTLPAAGGEYVAQFGDKASITASAVPSAELAVQNGVITGKPGNVFDPKGLATRAEAAAVIYRLFILE